jgi:hypothetical protein
MPDPFSVVSGAAGIVSLGLTLCQGLVAYYGPFNAFDSGIGSLVTRVKELKAILELLQYQINTLQTRLNPYIADEMRLVANRMNDCGGR